jgi:hypothetical protein
MKPYHIDAQDKCGTCKFWDDYGDEKDAKPRSGACCRFPPVRNGTEDTDDTAMYMLWSHPVTGSHWWCGEHQGCEHPRSSSTTTPV